MTPKHFVAWAVAAFGLLVLSVAAQGVVVLRDWLVRRWRRKRKEKRR